MSDQNPFVDRASDPAFSINADARITGWNERLTEMTGYAAADVVGAYCGSILQARLPDGVLLCTPDCGGHACLLAGKPFSVSNCFLRTRDGRLIEAEFSTLALRHADAGEQEDEMAVVFVRQKGTSSLADEAELLRIYGFGEFDLVANGTRIAVEGWQRKKAATLLKVMITNRGRSMHRERLAEILWPDVAEKKGWERLRVTIYALRKELRAAGLADTIIQTVDKSYRLNSELVWLDFEAFEASIEAGLALEKSGNSGDALNCFEDAQRLYRGDFLADEIYSDWCAEKREQLRELYLEMLASLVRCYEEQSQFARAAQTCRTALACDPCRENFLRGLIRNLVQIGRADRARAEYLYWQSILHEELGVEPLPETRQLYAELVEGAGSTLRHEQPGLV